MKTNRLKMACLLGSAALLASAMSARAAEFLFTYTTLGGPPLIAHLDVVTGNTFDAFGNLDVLSVTGDLDGTAISGLLPAGTPTGGGLWNTDNKLYIGFDLSRPWFDNYGLGFTTVTGKIGNLFSVDLAVPPATGGPGNSYSFGTSLAGSYTEASNGSLSVTQIAGVPEPASWALMITGFGLTGAMLRRRRTTPASAVSA